MAGSHTPEIMASPPSLGVPSAATPAGTSEAALPHAGPVGGLVQGILGAVGVHAFELRVRRARAAAGGIRRRGVAAGFGGPALVLGVRRGRPRRVALAGRFLGCVVAGRDVGGLGDIGVTQAPRAEDHDSGEERHGLQSHAKPPSLSFTLPCYGLPRTTRTRCDAPSSASTTSPEPFTGTPSSSTDDTPRLTPPRFSTTTSYRAQR